jgi:hypothetical protein
MSDYAGSFASEDRERIFRFFALFSRTEYALKRRWAPKPGKYGVAWADWAEFAKVVEPELSRIESECGAERAYLRDHPPLQQVVKNGALEWRSNPKRGKKESDAGYLLRVIRDVRNNLFHGGKARDRTRA